jgi:hypothetical protein
MVTQFTSHLTVYKHFETYKDLSVELPKCTMPVACDFHTYVYMIPALEVFW